jgi:hypothetical protein
MLGYNACGRHTRGGPKGGAPGRVTLTEHYAYHLHERREYENLTQRMTTLFQQFCVDSYAKIVTNNLQFIRDNQTLLRIDSYRGMKKWLYRQYFNCI